MEKRPKFSNVLFFQVAFWRPADRPYRHVDIWIHGAGEKMLSALSERNIAYKMHLTNLTHSAELRNVSMKNIDTYDRIYHSFKEVGRTGFYLKSS